MAAYIGALEDFEFFKNHIRRSKAILLRILFERRGALAVLSCPGTAQKPPKGATEVPKWRPRDPQMGPKQFEDVLLIENM